MKAKKVNFHRLHLSADRIRSALQSCECPKRDGSLVVCPLCEAVRLVDDLCMNLARMYGY